MISQINQNTIFLKAAPTDIPNLISSEKDITFLSFDIGNQWRYKAGKVVNELNLLTLRREHLFL